MVILDLVEQVVPLADGMSVRISSRGRADATLARRWCELTGNTLAAVSDEWIEVRRGRPVSAAAALPPQHRPGVRLWMYTNFDCNLSCAYCCVRSSPVAPRRALGRRAVARVVGEAAACGVAEFFLTGGEPFVLADIGDIIVTCVAQRPTTVLTNGMLFRGRRLETLRGLPRQHLTLQISLDSPRPDRHDRNRGAGTWAKAMAGIRTAIDFGFRVRVAATVDLSDPPSPDEFEAFAALLNDLGIAHEDRLTRALAHRGNAASGVELAPETIVPEVTVTDGGVYWHPVGADDSDMLIDREIFPLAPRIERIVELFEAQAQQQRFAAMMFPCA